METLLLEDISDHEEGEIVEDELEDVSDCSLTAGSPLNPGKSVSTPEILNGVCLSKRSNRYIRDKSFIYYGTQRRRTRRKKRNSQNGVAKQSHGSRLRRASIIEIISDSEEDMIDPRYAKQLREALCRESVEASTNNSLKTRLKALIENSNSHSEDEGNLDALRDLALVSTFKSEQSKISKEFTSQDKESEFKPCDLSDSVDMELQELRLEALKSVILKNHERRKRKVNEISDTANEIKDIDKENDKSIINNKKIKMDSEETSAPEHDLSLDTSQTKIATGNAESVEEDADILRAGLLASMSKNLSNKPDDANLKVPFEVPKVVVKPLIINLNADSDSDTEVLESSPKNAFKNTVSEFLKRQRAKVEANVKKKTGNNYNANINKPNDLNKSAMKLLPRSQQLEYHKLKQQLLNAHKKAKTRRNSFKILHSNKETNNTSSGIKKSPFYKTSTHLTNNNRILVNKTILKNNVEKKPDAISHLRSALDDLQITKNGRLQMKGKYRSLSPLLNKINNASNERQQAELLIKKLLQDIQIARTELANSHQNFTNLVHELVKEKRAIDERVSPYSAPTVVKPTSNENIQQVKTSNTDNIDVRRENAIEGGLQLAEKNLVEPNDITKMSVKQFTEDFCVPKYNSPLNYRNIETDPVTTICPYALLGVCKDKECPYVHYS